MPKISDQFKYFRTFFILLVVDSITNIFKVFKYIQIFLYL